MNPVALIYRTAHPVMRVWWFIRRPSVYASAAAIERKGKILLVRRTYGRRAQWDMPGGYRNPGEDAGAAAVREAIEETGIVLHGTKHLITEHFTEYNRKVELAVYHGTGFGNIKVDPHEIAEAAWYRLDRLPPNVGEGTRRATAVLKGEIA